MYEQSGEAAVGQGGAFTDIGIVEPMDDQNNTFLESQFTLDGLGIEYQLTYDGNYDVNDGNQTANPMVDEPIPAWGPTTTLSISSITLGDTGTPGAVDLTNLQTAIDTSQVAEPVALMDASGILFKRETKEKLNSPDYAWGEYCDFGRGTIRLWAFLEWTGAANYRLILAGEERQFSGADNTSCAETPLNAITLRTIATRTLQGQRGCGDGNVDSDLGEECEGTGAASCSALGLYTNAAVNTTCNPTTCTYDRTGCYAGIVGPVFCNPLTAQCFDDGGTGTFGIATCSSGGGLQTCTDCLDDPAVCPTQAAIPTAMLGSTTINVPNTAYSLSKLPGLGATFPVTIAIGTLGTASGASAMSVPTADGSGDCVNQLLATTTQICNGTTCTDYGWCENASCQHVCGEMWDDGFGAWHMTYPHAGNRFANRGFEQNLRCQNLDEGANGRIPNCATNADYTQVISEWDELQYRMRERGLDPNTMHNGVALGAPGGDLTWGQKKPLIEGSPGQNCAGLTVNVNVTPPFDPSVPGDYDTVMTIDRSGSMGLPSQKDPMVLRADLATSAGLAVLQTLSDIHQKDPMVNYNMGLTSFSTNTTVESGLLALDAPGLAGLQGALQGRPAPLGRTAVGDAIRTSYAELAGSARDRFLVLVSDGFNNEGEDPVKVTEELMDADKQLHVCPVYFGAEKDQAEQLIRVADAGKCSMRMSDPNTNDIVSTMFTVAGERAGGTVIFADSATVEGTVILYSGFLSLLTGNNNSVSSTMIVAPEMTNLKLMLADSGRELTPWDAPTITLTPPSGSPVLTLDASTATYDESGRGYMLFDLPVSGSTQAGEWQIDVTAPSGAANLPITSNITVIADESEAQCALEVVQRTVAAGDTVDVRVTPTYNGPLNPARVTVEAAIVGPSQDGTKRTFPLTLIPGDRGAFVGRFTPPADNGIYTVSALCEGEEALTDNIEHGSFDTPYSIHQVPPFRVQTSSAFLVYGGSAVCVTPQDCDGDGVLDVDEPAGDADGDGIDNRNDIDSDDDGLLDIDEIGLDADGDGIDDMIDNDMDNDGVPDFEVVVPCSWHTTGGGSTRDGASTCVAPVGGSPVWTHDEWQISRGVSTDAVGTSFMVAKRNLFDLDHLLAVDATGAVLWREPLFSGTTTNPEVLSGDQGVATGDLFGQVTVRDAATGATLWSASIDAPALGLGSADGVLVVTTNGGSVYAFDEATGNLLWNFTSFLGVWGEPTFSPDSQTVYTTWNNLLIALRVSDGSVAWWVPQVAPFSSAPAVGPDGSIYVGGLDAAIYAYSPGGTLRWRHQLLGLMTQPPAVDGSGVLYFSATDTFVQALQDNGTFATQLWATTLIDVIWAGPALAADGTLFVGTQPTGRLYALDATTGSIMWAEPSSGWVLRGIAIGDNRLTFANSAGRLASY